MSTDDENAMMDNLRKLQGQLGAMNDQMGALQSEGTTPEAALEKAQGLLKELEQLNAQVQSVTQPDEATVPHAVKKAMQNDRE